MFFSGISEGDQIGQAQGGHGMLRDRKRAALAHIIEQFMLGIGDCEEETEGTVGL